MDPDRVAFYCVSDAGYFLGAVGLVNSLRVLGHDEPIYVLDAGLESGQRELLEPHATLVEPPQQAPPWLLKTVAPLRRPAETMVLIDADMIVTRRLDDLIEQAAAGRVVAFENDIDRFVPEWGDLLDLGPIHRQPYLCSGLVAMGRDPGEEVLGLMEDRSRRVDFALTFWRSNRADYPFLYADQDVLNAILSSRVAPDEVIPLDHRLMAIPPFSGLRVTDEAALRCAYEDGASPYVLHQYLPAKPWREPTYDGIYSRLLRRLLGGDDVAVRVPRKQVPLRLRTGPLAFAERRRVDAREQLRWRVPGLFGDRRASEDRSSKGPTGEA